MTIAEAKRVFEKLPPPCGLMRVSEAAAAAGLHPETVRRRIRRGEVRAWGFPHRVLVADLLQEYEPAAAKDGEG